MGDFVDTLRVGGRSNSLGRSVEVLDAVRREPVRLDELLAATDDEDAWVRMRAMDVLEKFCRASPGLLEPRLPELFRRLVGSAQPSVQWHLAQILGQVALPSRLVPEAVDWLVGLVSSVDVDWIVSVNVMRTLQGLARRGLVPVDRLAAVVERQAATTPRRCAGTRCGSPPSSGVEAVRSIKD